MKITNKYNLPNALVNIANMDNEPHNEKNTFSATTILKGEKEIILENRHFDEIEMDISDMTWTIFGTAVHSLAEKEVSEKDGTSEMKIEYCFIKEDLVKMGFSEELANKYANKYKLTGRCDLYNEKEMLLQDYKTATVWKFIYGDFDEWEKQGYIYTWLLRKNNQYVKDIKFHALLKDWNNGDNKMAILKNNYYPPRPITTYSFQPNEIDLIKIQDFIFEKVKKLITIIENKIQDNDIEYCNEKERWQTKTTYAVMKKNRKTALKVFNNLNDANAFIKDNSEKNILSIETRFGQARKCIDYCIAHEYCSYYIQTKGE